MNKIEQAVLFTLASLQGRKEISWEKFIDEKFRKQIIEDVNKCFDAVDNLGAN